MSPSSLSTWSCWLPALAAALPLAVVAPALVVIDLRERRLPNGLVARGAAGLPVGWALAAAAGDGSDAVRSAAVLGIVGLLLVAAAVAGAVGMGDAKLGAVLAAALAVVDGVSVVVGGAVAAGAGGLVAVGSLRRRRRRGHGAGAADGTIALGPCLLAGYGLALVLAISRGGSC